MSSSGSSKLMERLNNDEFLKLLPHLSLEHAFLTQIFVPKKKWIPMLDVNFQILQVKCGGCSKQVKFSDLKTHLKQNDHEKSLRSNVKQFYHPFYTYGKGDIKLSRGEHVSKDMRDNALRELEIQMKIFKKDCLTAKNFAESVKRRERDAEDDILLRLTLNATIKKPEDMFVKVSLPFEDVPKLLFCMVGGEWQPVASYKQLNKKANFHCNICGVNCSGIGSLNSHSNGYTHKLRQLEVVALRYESSSKVNKNCCIQFGDSFFFSVKEEAKDFFKDQLGKASTTVGDSNAMEHVELLSDIAKKVKALNEFVPKALTSKESLDTRKERNIQELGGKNESNNLRGHLGVEYILKIIKHVSDRDPKFECGLCEFMGDANRMQRHLLNYDHKKKYLDLHYSDTIKKFESTLGHMRFMEFRAVMSEIVEKVAIEVEKTHSRSLPYTVSSIDYKVRRPDLIAEVYALLHASQNRGPSFANVLSLREVMNLKKCAAELVDNKIITNITNVVFTTAPPNAKIYLHQMSHDPVVRLREYNAKMKNKSRELRRSMSPARAQIKSDNFRKNDHRSRSRSPISYARNISPKRGYRPDGESLTVQHHNIWDVYRREIAIAANEMEHAYENYRKNPESHPLYEEEWNSFWQQRKKELEREGVNHRAYNFQPEWVHYFKQRIEQLFGEALHKSQINIRQKLEIPLDAEEDCQHSRVIADKIAEGSHMHDRGKNPEELGEHRANKRKTRNDFMGGPPSSKRQFPDEVFVERSERITVQQQNMVELVTNINDNHSNVVHVLRLMTALEEHLGSLGGKVMDLLSSALQMEKTFRGNNIEFESKILTATNCHLLETAVEKLKGILFAGLLDDKKVSGFNRIIQYTTNLLKYAEKMGWRREILTERTSFHGRDSPRRDKQKHMNIPQRSSTGNMQSSNEKKALSDTLMDLVSSSQRNKQSMKVSNDHFFGSVDHHSSKPLVCPPPPSIKGTNLNASIFPSYNGQQNSGLASFNTKLSLDQSHSQQSRQNQTHRAEICHLQHRGANIGGNKQNNNSFKNNNDARTTANSRPNHGPNVGGGISNTINSNSGPGPQFKNTQFIPKLDHTNAMYLGVGEGIGGGNHNQNWSRWN